MTGRSCRNAVTGARPLKRAAGRPTLVSTPESAVQPRSELIAPCLASGPSRSASASRSPSALSSAACLVVALVGVNGASGIEAGTHTVQDGARTHELIGSVKEAIALNADAAARHLYVLDGDLAAQDAEAEADRRARVAKMAKTLGEIKKIHADDVALVEAVEAKLEPFNAAVAKAVAASRRETVAGVQERNTSRSALRQERRARPFEGARGRRSTRSSTKLDADLDEGAEAAFATGGSTKRTILIAGLLVARAGRRPRRSSSPAP